MKGSFIALTKIYLRHPITGEEILVSKEEPSKFDSLRFSCCVLSNLCRKKEQAFWEKKKKRTEEELKMTVDSDLPVAYLKGTQEFFGLEFDVSRGVFIPRKGTEVLVQAVVKCSQELEKQGKVCKLYSFTYKKVPNNFGFSIAVLAVVVSFSLVSTKSLA